MLAHTASASQREIDQMFNAYARGEPRAEHPVGIDGLTLEKVLALFADREISHTAETVAQTLKLSRTTARRYLEYAAGRQQIRAEIVYGKVGRPQRSYRGTET